MKLALLFVLVAAAAVLSHSAPVKLDVDATHADTAQVDDAQVDDVQVPNADESMLTGLLATVVAAESTEGAKVAAESTENVQVETSDKRREDVGSKHAEIHKTNGIIDLIDSMLSKVVATVARSNGNKVRAEGEADKAKKSFDAFKKASDIATEEYIAENAQAEKEKAMIYQIRAMVIRLNKGQLGHASCKDAQAAGETRSGVYDMFVKDNSAKHFKVYCDMTTAGGGWTLAMRTMHGGDAFNYESSLWTTPSVSNEHAIADGGFASSEAKFDSFNVIPASEILLKSDRGVFTQLGMTRVSTLLDLFKGGATRLNVISGQANPQNLLTGGGNGFCSSPWRTNSQPSSGAKIRLGGWYVNTWGCGYGTDGLGEQTSPEQAGLGMWDNTWGPIRTTGRSSGTRSAHNYEASGGGQRTVGVTVWVR